MSQFKVSPKHATNLYEKSNNVNNCQGLRHTLTRAIPLIHKAPRFAVDETSLIDDSNIDGDTSRHASLDRYPSQHWAPNAAEVESLVREFQPSALVVDLQMPGNDGVQVLNHLPHRSIPQPTALMRGTGNSAWIRAGTLARRT